MKYFYVAFLSVVLASCGAAVENNNQTSSIESENVVKAIESTVTKDTGVLSQKTAEEMLKELSEEMKIEEIESTVSNDIQQINSSEKKERKKRDMHTDTQTKAS